MHIYCPLLSLYSFVFCHITPCPPPNSSLIIIFSCLSFYVPSIPPLTQSPHVPTFHSSPFASLFLVAFILLFSLPFLFCLSFLSFRRSLFLVASSLLFLQCSVFTPFPSYLFLPSLFSLSSLLFLVSLLLFSFPSLRYVFPSFCFGGDGRAGLPILLPRDPPTSLSTVGWRSGYWGVALTRGREGLGRLRSTADKG